MEYDGKHYKQPPTAIRPAPFKSFRGRTYAAAVSPESARIMAKLGVGLLIIPQKPWREVEKELTEYNTLYREINGTDAPQPISAGWIFVDESAERAREMAMKYIGGYYRTVLDHYQFAGAHMKNQRGYEYYAKMNEKLAVYGDQKAIEFFADLQVYGTPEQVYDKIMAIHKQTNNSAFVGVFSYAGMPHEEAARNVRLFAATVMPELQKFDAGAPIDRAVAAARPCASPSPRSKATVSLTGHRRPRVWKGGLDAFHGTGPAGLEPLDIGVFDRPRPWRWHGHGGHGHGAAASTAHPHS